VTLRHRWTTRQDGVVEVDGTVPMLSAAGRETMRRRVLRWLPSATRHGDANHVPVAWILGVIYAESGGVATVVSPDRGHGLMQLTHPSVFKGHRPLSTLANPDLNIALGVELMASLRRSVGFDLPKIASGYNAGLGKTGSPHASSSSPWGMRETRGHIDRVVRAANTAAQLLGEPMGTDARARIVEAARGEIGPGDIPRYWEAGGIAFTPDVAKRAWCGLFALWAIKQGGVAAGVKWEIGLGFVGPQGLPRTKTPKPGDICYDDQPWQHYSIVESLTDGVLTTIDGNQPDVRRKVRPLPSDVVFYSIEKLLAPDAAPDTDPAPARRTLRRGDYGADVAVVQRQVGARADGDFGPLTEAAVKAWQRARGLYDDGIVGPKTWSTFDV